MVAGKSIVLTLYFWKSIVDFVATIPYITEQINHVLQLHDIYSKILEKLRL